MYLILHDPTYQLIHNPTVQLVHHLKLCTTLKLHTTLKLYTTLESYRTKIPHCRMKETAKVMNRVPINVQDNNV